MEELELFLNDHRDEFMFEIPEYWKEHVDYETFLGELKCVSVLLKWIDESKEDEILEYFRVEPGDLYRLIETADWLLYATYELAKLFKHRDLLPKIYELRVRVANGVKSELIPLVALEGVGRIRARALFNSGYKTIEILKHTSISDLLKVPGIGPQMVKKIKEQVGGFIKKEEIEKLKAEKTEQKTLTEF
jgi:helicase